MAGRSQRSGWMVVQFVRTWIAVMRQPRRFFFEQISPGDQAPGLLFAMAIVAIEESLRMGLRPAVIPPVADHRFVSAVLAIGIAVLLITPVVLHLLAALQTIILIGLLEDRAGVSETVQLIAYAAAPCALAGFPIPELRMLLAIYGTGLLVLGLMIVHGASRWQAVLAAIIPAGLLFGYGFRGFAAALSIAHQWHLI